VKQGIPDPTNFPELQQGTPEYSERLIRLEIWDKFDMMILDFIEKYNISNQMRVECFEIIKKYTQKNNTNN
jgi:hypothetical protein